MLKKLYWNLQREEAEVEKMNKGPENAFLILVEKTKLYDRMYIDTGIKIHWLNTASVELDLTNDPEIVEWRQASLMQDKIKHDALQNDNQLS